MCFATFVIPAGACVCLHMLVLGEIGKLSNFSSWTSSLLEVWWELSVQACQRRLAVGLQNEK